MNNRSGHIPDKVNSTLQSRCDTGHAALADMETCCWRGTARATTVPQEPQWRAARCSRWEHCWLPPRLVEIQMTVAAEWKAAIQTLGSSNVFDQPVMEHIGGPKRAAGCDNLSSIVTHGIHPHTHKHQNKTSSSGVANPTLPTRVSRWRSPQSRLSLHQPPEEPPTPRLVIQPIFLNRTLPTV